MKSAQIRNKEVAEMIISRLADVLPDRLIAFDCSDIIINYMKDACKKNLIINRSELSEYLFVISSLPQVEKDIAKTLGVEEIINKCFDVYEQSEKADKAKKQFKDILDTVKK